MEKLRDPQTGGETEPNDQRMQSFIPIEVVILSGIDQIKSTHPTHDSKGKDERRQFHPACLRDPGRDRRNPEGETKKKVRCVSKMFGERIEKMMPSAIGESANVSRLIFAAKKTKR